MTVYYVAADRPDDTGNGLTVATAKKTLNAVEDLPVVAGDLVHVKAGTYRELLTCDVSGSAGNVIEYRGDYLGTVFGTGGVVRITGSADDIALTRANCITATSKNYRTFTGFVFDLTSGASVNVTTSTDWTINKCSFNYGTTACYQSSGAGQARHTIQNCSFWPSRGVSAILFTHTSAVDNAAHVVENCLIVGTISSNMVNFVRVGGTTVRNCIFWYAGTAGVRITTAITVGQTVVVNNCLFQACNICLQATVTGEIIEDYNAFFGNLTDRTNVNTGANSNVYPALVDQRWFFQLVYAGGGPNNPFQVVSPFDLASYSALLNVAGTSPPATDLRGTAVQGAQREWGPLEYDPTLMIDADRAKARYQIGM